MNEKAPLEVFHFDDNAKPGAVEPLFRAHSLECLALLFHRTPWNETIFHQSSQTFLYMVKTPISPGRGLHGGDKGI